MTAGQASASFFLKRSREIQLIKKNGRRVSTGLFNLQICRGTMPQDTMMGIVIGRRFGTAVRRNRAKRLFRELGRAVRPTLIAGQAFLVFPKRHCLNVPFVELQSVWRSTLQRQRLAHPGDRSS
jgi:ribonuclease P protein component